MAKKHSTKLLSTAACLLAAFITATPAPSAAAAPPDTSAAPHAEHKKPKTAPVITVSVVSNIYGIGTLQTLSFNSEQEFRTYIRTGLDPLHVKNLYAGAGYNLNETTERNYSPELQAAVSKSGYAHFEIDGNFQEGEDAKFAGWDFSNLDLSGAKIRNMMFTFVRAENTVFDKADIDNSVLSGMYAPNSSWRNVTFGEDVKASGCIENVTTDFTGADFTGTPFRNMNWGRAILDNATLPHIIDGTNLEGASLKNAKAYRTEFSNSYIAFTHIEGANLSGSTFHDMGPIMNIFIDGETNMTGVKYTGNSVPQLELKKLQSDQEYPPLTIN